LRQNDLTKKNTDAERRATLKMNTVAERRATLKMNTVAERRATLGDIVLRKNNLRLHARMRRGLTLLELMIVLIILVGLMAIVGPRLLGTQQKADVRTAQAQVGNLASALKMYAADMKIFPSTEEGLELLVTAPDDEALARNWDGPYIEGGKLPLDPWGGAFQYEYGASDESSEATTHDFPRIFSMGPDRQPSTADDIGNRPADGEEEPEAEIQT
jgi:general secretion pathway protein G